jgi:hypothetical protein
MEGFWQQFFATSSLFDSNTVSSYLSYQNIHHLPSYFTSSCLANEEDLLSSFNRPPVPPRNEYLIPRRKITNEDVLIVERAKEDRLCALFRQDGYAFRAELYKSESKWSSLRFLRLWRMVNQHIPEIYLTEGTRSYEPPEDALLAAIVEDVELGEEEELNPV